MSIAFRINRVSLNTIGGKVEYAFPSALTVLAGSVGVGKSTLFELIKHGLGGDALLADVVDTSVTSVTLDVTIGARRLLISRATSTPDSDRTRVYDLLEQVELEDHFIAKQEPTLSSLLLSAMGLPDDMRAAAKSGSTNQGARITFYDVLKYMYVSQADINKHIAGSGDSYYQPKRRAVFEVLLDLTNPGILETQSMLAKVRGEWEQANRDFSVVTQFLADSNTPSRIDAERAQLDAARQQENAQKRLASIRDLTSPAIDRETQTLRDLLGEAERNLGDAQSALAMLQQQRTDYGRERSLLKQDIDRIGRMQSAGERLAEIEFTVCPRCMQSLKKRPVPDHLCRVCLQDDPVTFPSSSTAATYEQVQLREQVEELGAQIHETELEIAATRTAIDSRKNLIVELSKSIDIRTRERITPQLQAYADATAQVAEATALQSEIEKTLQQWDRADDLERVATTLKTRMELLRDELDQAEEALEARRTEIFDELDEEFSDVVFAIRIPGVSTAAISRSTYLPVLNGKAFDRFSPVGGVRTATQVAYWIALMNVTLRRRDTHFPGFLLIDSPRTSLNDSDDLSAALYRKLVTMADAAKGRVQVIIGDNELPADYRRDYQQIDFDYDHPTIGTIHHPGRDAVTRITDSE
ncbi:hypothetical protein [Mycobacteroides abscessus]|uniref:hypothetical protein n=1 Tax=Mycobacteroides abscessus TaxID=36809 RepID=UPI000241CAA1|nr:hypothetical protein [Mycobacteroides abscessus]AMU66837.1 hypothetical protein A3O04_17305 [Mycobacteroides abscessus]EHM16427.1 hypothetical protein MMAS_33490 [Mycobacteroides abscessus subsp. massiliense CCUG 48898 = JCM 15300]EIV64585.1 hypothetical protein MMCCUG48898_3497 [Mycobacteroides abscessus subsp. massiliense CCUG 48898 = JCM 15300]MBE5431920.1 hypothetical protein [Mycobacteroides abscessus]MBE5504030.1 hypothetical protein [Mycobacteroides abscessus]